MLRLLVKLPNPVRLVDRHHTILFGRFQIDLDTANRHIGTGLHVFGHHRTVIHSVDVITAVPVHNPDCGSAEYPDSDK